MSQPPSRGGQAAKGLAARALLWSSAGTIATIAALAAVALLTVVGAKSVADQQACGGGSELTEISLSGLGENEIPAELLPIYRAAAEHYELGPDGYLWLAAVNRVETHFGTNMAVSSAGAQGWMQFMPATWASYGVDADGDGTKDPRNPRDAIYGAANYLHASGAPGDWHRAILAYNHAEWYFLDVQGYKERYGKGVTSSPSPAPATVAADADAVAGGASTPASGPGAPAGGQAGELARGREGTVAFAMADRSGEIRASLRGERPFNGASLTKAMLLVAALRERGRQTVPASERATLEAMIAASDNAAANRTLARVGTGGVREVARVARMTGFRLSTADPVYRLGDSKITANDQARFFARIDLLMPRSQRQFGLELLASKVPGQRWGMLDAQLPGTIYSKAGWRPERSGGWTVNQAARIDTPEGIRGIAVLSAGAPSEAYGRTTMAQVGGALAQGGADGSGIDEVLGGCALEGASSDPGADVQLTEGDRAKLLPDGTAAAPASAPAAVKAMIAAGNRIQGRPYVYGGGHGSDLREISPNNYDCSSSVSYLLYWGGFIANPRGTLVSGPLGSSFGAPGPGRWVTIRGNAGHVYMYVAGLRWDTHRYGAGDTGVAGVGWHTAVRPAAGFGARHPGGL